MRLLVLINTLVLLASRVICHEDDDNLQETTTEPNLDTTTTGSPSLELETVDYQFTSLTSGFAIDVNFTEISGDSERTIMSMKVATTDAESEFSKSVCSGNARIIAIPWQECPPGIESLTTVDGDVIATIKSTSKY